ncbi:MAG TPA: acyl-CoA synthetase FdrA [bacterium]|nr:acyl-CoA synthetase FdrA [bacterium]
MILKNIIKKNTYQDSVFLMSIANRVKSLKGIEEVSCLMGTPENKKLLAEVNLLTKEGEKAEPDDLLISISARDKEAIKEALEKIKKLLTEKEVRKEEGETILPKSLDSALNQLPDANLVHISIPGKYVRWEAEKALERGLNLFIFSDNVSLEDELELKKIAKRKGLLVMGPDCGTAIINGIALGFANVIRGGNIGIVAAAGTGLQEVSVLIHKAGLGISQGIGTGGRDLSKEIGGITMLQGIKALEDDPGIKIIVLISKPPAEEVADRIIKEVKRSKKPFVINFLGSKIGKETDRIHFASTLEEAAHKAIALSKGEEYKPEVFKERVISLAKRESSKLKNRQKYIRGLFSGGTLCDEAMLILKDLIGDIYSNIPLRPSLKLKDSRLSQENSLVDLGDDEFTRGRPHPMIDFTLRNERIIQEARDPQTAVILLDIVLGYGAYLHPANALASAIEEAKEKNVSVIASLCGTEDDPQDYKRQREELEKMGVIIMPSNAQAARLAALIITRGRARGKVGK